MAKNGLYIKDFSQIVKPDCDWALCIGAGCSLPVFPSWQSLSESIARAYSFDLSINNKCKHYLSPDILIQSTYERAGRPDDYADVLSEMLYENLFEGLKKDDKQLVIKCLTSQMPAKAINWNRYIEIICEKGKPSSLQIAEFIVDSMIVHNRPPRSILTFNAELLMPSVINAFAHIKYNQNFKILDYITEPISARYQGRIPFFFCHGLVPVPGSDKTAQKNFNAKDKLVFSENEYLQLANNSYSWQASSFMSTLTNSTVYFVGLSFTDPNIRRWLSWLHRSRIEAIHRMDETANESTAHYWIEKEPRTENERRWIEASVAHLGIRLLWVSDYTEIVDVLKKSIK